jgi:glutathione S-transferase
MTGLTDPILFSFRRCPYAMRARLALIVSGIRCELREVQLRAKPAEMLAVSPKGTVPVLMPEDGCVIDESLDIMRWALSRQDPEGWLERDDPVLIARNDHAFKHDLDRYKYPERHGSDPAAHREAGLVILQDLESRLALQPQLCGDLRGLADIAIMPFVRQFAAVDPAWFASQALPRLQAWLARHLASDLFAAAMLRVPAWTSAQASIYLPAVA